MTCVGEENMPARVHGEDRRRRPRWLGSGDDTRPGQQVVRDGFIEAREGTWAVARPWKAGRGTARRRRRGWRGREAMPAKEREMRGIYRRSSAPG
jgi:hypothetical protein